MGDAIQDCVAHELVSQTIPSETRTYIKVSERIISIEVSLNAFKVARI